MSIYICIYVHVHIDVYKMLINGSKCHSITLNFSSHNVPPQNLTLQGNIIQPVEEINLLGVVITKNLKWSRNTSIICSKVNRKFFILSRLKQFGFQKKELLTAWTSMIRPLAEYAAPLWHSGLSETDSRRLEFLQKKALSIIYGTEYIQYKRYYKINNLTLKYEEALKEIGLTSLHDRREVLTRNFALQSLGNEMHKDMFIEKNTDSKDLRNNDKVIEYQCRTKRYYNSAIPSMARIINSTSVSQKL